MAIQEADFDVSAELASLRDGDGGIGAIASFVGTVRGSAATVREMWLEHYPGMTERAIEAMADDAGRRFDIRAVRVVHRVGRLLPGEQIVLVAVASAHRREAFQACEFVMDWLKTQAPFWKKERTPQGERWVDARESDDAATARWGAGATPNAGDAAR